MSSPAKNCRRTRRLARPQQLRVRRRAAAVDRQHRERLRAEARKETATEVANARQRDIADLKFHHNLGVFVTAVIWVAIMVGALISSRAVSAKTLYVVIAGVVVLGGFGLICRGVGELVSSSRWKATGYFMGATAFFATATAALVNVLPRLLGVRL